MVYLLQDNIKKFLKNLGENFWNWIEYNKSKSIIIKYIQFIFQLSQISKSVS